MNDNSLKELLQQADQALAPPETNPPLNVEQMRQILSARRRKRRGVAIVALGFMLAGGVWIVNNRGHQVANRSCNTVPAARRRARKTAPKGSRHRQHPKVVSATRYKRKVARTSGIFGRHRHHGFQRHRSRSAPRFPGVWVPGGRLGSAYNGHQDPMERQSR